MIHRHGQWVYDNRIANAIGNTTFALDAYEWSRHTCDVRNQAEIVAALKAKRITQVEIAEVLGVQQPNAATLFKPAKNGKYRKLSFDEGQTLIERFNLFDDDAHEPVNQPSEETLQAVLAEVLRLSAEVELPESKVRPAARHLSLFLELLSRNPAIHANPDAIKAVADAIASQLPVATP